MNEHPLALRFVGFRWKRMRYGLKRGIKTLVKDRSVALEK